MWGKNELLIFLLFLKFFCVSVSFVHEYAVMKFIRRENWEQAAISMLTILDIQGEQNIEIFNLSRILYIRAATPSRFQAQRGIFHPISKQNEWEKISEK